MKYVRNLAITLLALVALGVSAEEPSSGELSVEEILEKHRQALGGEALAELESLRLEGTYAYNGLEHPLVEWRARPDLLRREIDGLQRFGAQRAAGQEVVRAHGPGGAWAAEAGGAGEMDPKEAPSFAAGADFEGVLVGAAEKGHRVELVGREELGGTEALHLRVTLAGGGIENWWLDAESYLPLQRAVEPSDAIIVPHTWYYDDWREVAGVQVPFYVMAEEKIFAREYLYEKAEANVEVEKTVFESPDG